MPRLKNAIVLVTRPRESSDRFVAALRAVAGPFEAVISPAFENEALVTEIPAFEIAVFTSRSGVAFAPEGGGRTAYCVGDATARAATRAGYRAISARGDADALVSLILMDAPLGRLLHLRGQVSHGDICTVLQRAGLVCSEAIVYRKVRAAPSARAEAVLAGKSAVLLPIFSAETATLLAEWPGNFRKARIIAISPAVADAAAGLHAESIEIAPRPDFANMVKLTHRLFA